MISVILALLVGVAFGVVLQKGQLGRYDVIVGVFRFADLTVLKVLVTGVGVAMLGLQSLRSLGVIATVPLPATHLAAQALGGVMFGVGMALAGFCPGTVAIGAGEGRLDNVVAGSLGITTGALVFGALYRRIVPRLAALGDLGQLDFARLLDASPWLVVALYWECALLLFYILERRRARSLQSA
ncbi:MAG: YeeE/YedE thiosulfate transporter family protein [Polyangiales bacterium]